MVSLLVTTTNISISLSLFFLYTYSLASTIQKLDPFILSQCVSSCLLAKNEIRV